MDSMVSLSSDSSSSIERSFGKMDLLAYPKQADLDDDLSTSTDDDGNSSTSASIPEETKSIYEGNKPLVLELHDMARDKHPRTTRNTEPKKKLRKRKKSKGARTKQASSSSPSDTSLKIKEETPKEQFYDAHESYHGIPPHQQMPAANKPADVSMAIPAKSEQGLDPKQSATVPTTTAASEALAAAKTAINKPIV